MTPQATEKRNLVDLFALREILQELPVTAHFTNSFYQIADCLTKTGRQHDLAEALKTGYIGMKICDEAAKKAETGEGFRLSPAELTMIAKLKQTANRQSGD